MKYLCYILSITLLIVVNGATHANTVNNLEFSTLNEDNGLSDNVISAIFQDDMGFLWFATKDGINKFDGLEFTQYKYIEDDTLSLLGNEVQDILYDKTRRIFVATNEGINLYNPATNSFYKRPLLKDSSLVYPYINKLHLDHSGKVYAITEEDIYYYDESREVFMPHQQVIDDIRAFGKIGANTAYVDNDGDVWFGGQFGLVFTNLSNNEKKQGIVEAMVQQILSFEGRIQDIKYFSESSVLISSSVGIFILDWNDEHKNLKHLVKDRDVSSTYKEGDMLYAATKGYGLVILDLKTNKEVQYLHYTSNEKSLSSNNLKTVFRDIQGNLWIGHFETGINVSYKKTKNFYTLRHEENNRNSLSADAIQSINIDDKGLVWIGTGDGVNSYDPKTRKIKYFQNEEGNLNSFSSEVLRIETDENYIYGGGWASGLVYLDRKTGIVRTKRFHKQHNHLSNFVRFIRKDSKGRLWVTSDAIGVHVLDKNFNITNTITGDGKVGSATDVFEDSDGDIWIGSFAGVSMFDGDDFTMTHYEKTDDPNSLAQAWVFSILQGSDGLMYFGTANGLSVFDKKTKTFTNYTEKHGLAHGFVNIRVEDDNKNIWIGTKNGVSLFNPETKTFKNYSEEDGLHGNEIGYSAAAKAKDGTIYLGGKGGITFFKPNEIKDNSYLPPVIITNLNINHEKAIAGTDDSPLTKNIAETKELILTHNQSTINFSFIALNYVNSKDNLYSYKMEGFDKNFTTPGAKREATYTNLNQGWYTFIVKASNNDGLWNDEGTIITIRVKPPWWKTLLFRILAGLTILVSGYFAYKIRVKSLKEQQRILEEKVEERTIELQTANTELHEQKEEIQQQAEELTTQRDALEEQREELRTKNEQISESYKRSEMLGEFGQKITSVLSIQAVNDMMYKYVSDIIDIHAFGIGIYNEQKGEVVFRHFIEDGQIIPPFVKNTDDPNSLNAYCINKQEAIYINNIDEEHGRYIQKLNEPSTSKTAYSRIHIPLTVEDKRIGIFVVNSFEKNSYSPDDFSTLKTLASYISIALDNARAYKQINDINKSVEESINYAQSIQKAFLPTQETLDKYLDNFVLFRPKDIVSGDYYWFSPIEKDPEKPLKAFVVVADCTGHGVPGSLISMIGNNLLNEIINIKHVHNPAQVLELLNVEFQLALKQDETRNNDGMDMVVCYLEELPETGKVKLVFSGAKNPCIIYHTDTKELETIKGSRKSIGGLRAKRSKQFYENVEKILNKNDILYLITDGIIDQHSPERERFTRDQLLKVLEDGSALSLDKQKEKLENALDKHQLEEKQTDDITLMGIKPKLNR